MSIIAGLAPAKINLSLRVICRRDDGFHELDSVVAFIDLCDSLLFSPAKAGVQELHMTGRTTSIAADATNLVLKAAKALSETVGRDLPFSVVLNKQIPAGAGLGGGSSDAATTLLALSELHNLEVTPEQLRQAAAKVGSDVAMFLLSGYGSCRMTGRGEFCQAMEWRPAGYCVLLLPEVHVPTWAVYGAWDEEPVTSPAAAWSDVPTAAEQWLNQCFNDLQPAAMRLFPQLEVIRERAERICGRRVVLTGSGGAMFTAFDSSKTAGQMAEQIGNEANVRTLVVPFRTRAGSKLPEVQHADH